MTKKLLQITILALSVTLFSACVKNENITSGYKFKYSKLQDLKVGKTRKAVVQRKLGTPSMTSDFGNDIWYYMSSEYERVAFFKPKVLRQEIVAIEFNKDQTIKKINEYSKDDIKEISVRSEITETEGHDLSILEQLLGNVGRFNPTPK